MTFRKAIKCPHCQYECVTTGDDQGDVTAHGTHGAFFHAGDMQRTGQYAATQRVAMWGCPACAKTFIELPQTKG